MSISFDDDKLYCYGCAHSASDSAYPGHPSGESACGSCLRANNSGTGWKAWDDPPHVDNYITLKAMRGLCEVCSSEQGFTSYICTTCYMAIREAANAEV